MRSNRCINVAPQFLLAVLFAGTESASALPHLSGVTTLEVGFSQSCVITGTGQVLCWGANTQGEAGQPPSFAEPLPKRVPLLSPAVSLALGAQFSCAVDGNGQAYCWGFNQYGQLGDGSTQGGHAPRATAAGIAPLDQLSAGLSHACAVDSQRQAWCWGRNQRGQLGNGTHTDAALPVRVSGLAADVVSVAAGDISSCALREGGEVSCWGGGPLGNGSESPSLVPVAVVGLPPLADALIGRASTFCARSAQQWYCWGDNAFGQLGDGSVETRLSATPVSALPESAVQLAPGQNVFTCALTVSGRTFCYGNNNSGQLGNGQRASGTPQSVELTRRLGSVVKLSSGLFHACALGANGRVMCWGSATSGALGDGQLPDLPSPAPVLDLAGPQRHIGSGFDHSCSVSEAGGLKCWGDNTYGQLGDGSLVARPRLVDVVGLDSGVTRVESSSQSTCALAGAGKVWCWGRNQFGQLGDGTTNDRATPVEVLGLPAAARELAVGGAHACVLVEGGALYCWGRNTQGQLGNGALIDSPTPVEVVGLPAGVAGISAGLSWTCAHTTDGAAFCWGDNSSATLGDGTQARRTTPVAVSGLDNGVARLAPGSQQHTCARRVSGGVSCWGINRRGQLGDGSGQLISGVPVPVVGLDGGVRSLASGAFSSCAAREPAGVACWGQLIWGVAGYDPADIDATPVAVPGMNEVVDQVSVGSRHACLLTADRQVRCWGYHGTGALGLGVSSAKLPLNVLQTVAEEGLYLQIERGFDPGGGRPGKGGAVQRSYRIRVVNTGYQQAGGLRLTLGAVAGLRSYSWTCIEASGAVCVPMSGDNPIDTRFGLDPEQSVLIELQAELDDAAPFVELAPALAVPGGIYPSQPAQARVVFIEPAGSDGVYRSGFE